MLITMALLGTTSITHAAGCSDGSEPVRTISSDGSYYVFKCGVPTKQTSSSNTNTNVGPVSINVHDEYQSNNFSGLVNLQWAFAIRTAFFGYVQIPLIDINDDGHKDLVFNSDPPYTANGVEVTQNTANLVVSPWIEEWEEYDMFDTLESPNTTFGRGDNMKVADFNGDGRMDMAVAVSSVGHIGHYNYGGIVLLTNTGEGIFTPKYIGKDGFTHAHDVGDLDNDGDIDIIYHQLGAKNITCAYNDGNANFTVKSCLRTPKSINHGYVQNIWGFRIADFDNDGFTDVLAIADHGSKRTTFFQNQYHNHQLKNPGIFWGNESAQFSWNDMTFIDLSEWNDKAFDKGEVYFTSGGASQATVHLHEAIVWNQACMPKFIDLNSDGIDDMICEGVSYVNTNEIERDRWENHSPDHKRITPFANTRDWNWEWGMGQTYYILDEDSNVLDEGHIFNKTRSDFSAKFKSGGYKIETVGYSF